MRKWHAQRCLAALLLLVISIIGVIGQNVSEEVLEEDADADQLDDGFLSENNATNVSAPTQAPTFGTMPPTSEDGCYTSLDDIFVVIGDDAKLFDPKRFVLCPGTVVEVGFLIPGVGIDKGQRPFVPRSNTEFLCGEDGKSENNCTILGGDFGLLSVPVFFRQDLTVTNVQVRGFTFVGQMQYASFIAVHGDISFYDCIFRDTANFGAMVYNFDSSADFSRQLEAGNDEFLNPWDHALSFVEQYRRGILQRRQVAEEGELADPELLTRNRGLQTYPEDATFSGVVKDCLFDNLTQVERELGVEFGIFTVKGPDHKIIVEDTIFSNNKYGDQELTPIGYAMLFQGCDLNLTRVCYVDNDFRGNAMILLEMTKNPLVEGTNMMTANYVTESDADLDCPFAAYFETEEDRRNSNFTCIPPQAVECGGENIPMTERAPALGPAPLSGGTADLLSRFTLVGGVIGAYLSVNGFGFWL